MNVGNVENNALYHHGIKGQKWGIRRFQNADGSLTAEGIRRYGIAVKNAPKYALDSLALLPGGRRSLRTNKNKFYKDLKKDKDLFNSKADVVINKNNKAYRMTPNKDEKDLKDVKNLFVAVNKKDASTYGKYLLTSRRASKQYQRTMGLNEDLKAPSVMKMKKYTYEVLNNKNLTDEEFDKIHNKMSKNQKLKLNRQMFDLNSIIPDQTIDKRSKENLEKFMEKVKKDNYNSLKDVHDEWYTNNPLIVLDADKSISELDTKRIRAVERSIMYEYGSYTYDELVNDIKHSDFLAHHGIKGMKWGVRHEDPNAGRTRFSRSAYEEYAKRYKLAKSYSKNVKRSTKALKRKWNEYNGLLKNEYGSKKKYIKENMDKAIADKLGISEMEAKIGKNVGKIKEGKKQLNAAGRAAATYAVRIGINKLLQEAGLKEEKDMTAFSAIMTAKAGEGILMGTVGGVSKIASAEKELKKIDLNEAEEERKKRKEGQNGGVSS